MSRKDYIAVSKAIAGEINWAEDVSSREAIRRVALAIASAMAKDNPLFNHATFMTACNLES